MEDASSRRESGTFENHRFSARTLAERTRFASYNLAGMSPFTRPGARTMPRLIWSYLINPAVPNRAECAAVASEAARGPRAHGRSKINVKIRDGRRAIRLYYGERPCAGSRFKINCAVITNNLTCESAPQLSPLPPRRSLFLSQFKIIQSCKLRAY